MAKKMKRFGALVLALAMCAGLFVTPASAATALTSGNVWNEFSVDVTAGTEGYTFMSVWNKICGAYEMGGHIYTRPEGNEIPQTFLLVDTEEYGGKTWYVFKKGDSYFFAGAEMFTVTPPSVG